MCKEIKSRFTVSIHGPNINPYKTAVTPAGLSKAAV